ncbi:hypothetical protein ACJX0J_025145, partial [Zea mays]
LIWLAGARCFFLYSSHRATIGLYALPLHFYLILPFIIMSNISLGAKGATFLDDLHKHSHVVKYIIAPKIHITPKIQTHTLLFMELYSYSFVIIITREKTKEENMSNFNRLCIFFLIVINRDA